MSDLQLKILLIIPRYSTSEKTPLGSINLSTFPLGLGYIAAVLELDGFSALILDLNAADNQTKTFESKLREINPSIVGISTMTSNFLTSVEAAQQVKKWNPQCIVVMGGVHATFMHKEILENVPEVDVIVRFDGEFIISDLAKTIEANRSLLEVKGISFRENGKVVSTPLRGHIENLDALPYPAHHLIHPSIGEYLSQFRSKNLPVITTRGCPFSCTYCSTMAFHGREYRTRSIANVISELEYLIEKFQVKSVTFVDDNFTVQNSRVSELCREIKKRNFSLDWGCSARVDQVSEELLKEMKAAGCTDIFFGIESASQRVLDFVRKGFTVEQAKDAVKTAEKVGIRTHCSFILGLPKETPHTLRNMVTFVQETKPTGRVLPNRLFILPGTELYQKKEEYFSNQKTIPDADLTKTQLEISTTFFKNRFGVKELFKIVPPNLEIE